MLDEIPLLDLSQCGLLVKDDREISQETFAAIGGQLYKAFSNSGFAYLSNHGISRNETDEMNRLAAEFYSLSEEQRLKVNNNPSLLHFGYDPIGTTKASDIRTFDYQRGFRVTGPAIEDEATPWPDVPMFKEKCVDLMRDCKILLLRLLKALAVGMKLKDPDYFCKAHSRLNRKGNVSMLKLIEYPPVGTDSVLGPNQLRLGEHSDWTTLILLFQDSNGGLQVKNSSGGFSDVTPRPGTIVVNVGDTMREWSGGRLRATIHRVVPPSDPDKRKNTRRTIIYFGQADNDVLMESLQYQDDFETKSEEQKKPMTVQQYVNKRWNEVFYH